jgi:hypothetical protein
VHRDGGAQGTARLLERDRLGYHHTCAQPECQSHASFAVDHGDSHGAVIGFRIAHCCEEASCVLLAIAIDDDQVVYLARQALDRGIGIAYRLGSDFQFTEGLGDGFDYLFVTAQNKRSGTHTVC